MAIGRRLDPALALAGLGLFLVVPPFLPQWITFLLTLAWAKVLAVLGIVLLLRGGLLTFGHALYYAVGAYTAGFAVKFLGVHEGLVVLGLAVVTGAAASALLGLLLARYRGVHFGLLNLAFSMVLYAILLKFYEITGGTDGLRLPTPLLAGVKPDAQHLRLTIYYVTVVLAALLLYVAYRFTTSPLGYTLRAVRDNEVRVEYMGASVRQAIYCSYIVAGVMASVGGVLRSEEHTSELQSRLHLVCRLLL